MRNHRAGQDGAPDGRAWVGLVLVGGWLSLNVAGADPIKSVNLLALPAALSNEPVWISRESSPSAIVEGSPTQSVRFPCPFQGPLSHVYWDRKISLDLRDDYTLEIDLFCANPEAFASLGLYLKSDAGWYLWLVQPREAGRQKLLFQLKQAATEGRPSGWDYIDGVRLRFTKAMALDTEAVVYGLYVRSSAVAVVQGTASVSDPGEREVSLEAARRLSRLLADTGVPHAVLDDDDVMAGKLKSFRVAILPYNPLPPRREVSALAGFLQRGGKLIVFYSVASPLTDLMGMKLGSYQAARAPGQWSLFRFNRKAPAHLPTEIFQESANIFPVYPKDERARVIAYWHNAAGKAQPDPAWVQSESGFWMTHILLNGDEDNKALMLLAMLGTLEPSVWKDAADKVLEQAGKIVGFMSLPAEAAPQALQAGLSQTTNVLTQQAADSPRRKAVQNLLAETAEQGEGLKADWDRGQYPDVVTTGRALRRTLIQAYALVQKPRQPEWRGIWDHSGLGLYPGNWDKTCRLLEEAGMNLLFVNLLWAGVSHYPSRVTSASELESRYGDQAKACAASAHRFHLKVHAWKVCWNLAQAPKSLVAELKKADRLQQTADGIALPWLCPTHPDNVALELNAITEIVGNYPLDGVQLDYIRYPDAQSCFCSGCRRRFEKDLGQKVDRWPKDVQSGALADRWLAWRSNSISDFVRAVSETLRKINPGIKLSAAVYPNYPECVAGIGQDWGLWLKEGWVDFVCPMDYMPKGALFQATVQRQLALPGATDRLYPGIGVSAMDSVLGPDQVIDQICRARAGGARGFVLFDLNRSLARDVLPMLKMGVTRKEE